MSEPAFGVKLSRESVLISSPGSIPWFPCMEPKLRAVSDRFERNTSSKWTIQKRKKHFCCPDPSIRDVGDSWGGSGAGRRARTARGLQLAKLQPRWRRPLRGAHAHAEVWLARVRALERRVGRIAACAHAHRERSGYLGDKIQKLVFQK